MFADATAALPSILRGFSATQAPSGMLIIRCRCGAGWMRTAGDLKTVAGLLPLAEHLASHQPKPTDAEILAEVKRRLKRKKAA